MRRCGLGGDRPGNRRSLPAGRARLAGESAGCAGPLPGRRHLLHGQFTTAVRIEAQMDRLLEKNDRTEANRRLAKHLCHEFPYLFTFLHCPDMEATNNLAERLAVEVHHLCEGSRIWNGARTGPGGKH